MYLSSRKKLDLLMEYYYYSFFYFFFRFSYYYSRIMSGIMEFYKDIMENKSRELFL